VILLLQEVFDAHVPQAIPIISLKGFTVTSFPGSVSPPIAMKPFGNIPPELGLDSRDFLKEFTVPPQWKQGV